MSFVFIMRIVFYIISLLGVVSTIAIYMLGHHAIAETIFYFLIIYILVGIYDVMQKEHTILRLYPVIGHLRYMLEFIRPEIHQYFIADDKSERPYSREMRSVIYQRAKNTMDTVPFGTKHDIYTEGYEFCEHSINACHYPEENTRIIIGGPQCKKPYNASILNISGMSFGALSPNAIRALNKGAKLGNFYHNTGEGGISKYHLEGGDLCWQIGTGYFGCRKSNGRFDPKIFKEKASMECVKMIELKISQGAKPSHGGILPKAKITKEISEFRLVPMDKDCESPPKHSEFDSPEGLMNFIQNLRELSGSKPVGFKLCIGKKIEFMAICKAMLKTKTLPDFITIDGAEGGTGAAPIEFTNRLGMTIAEAIMFVNNCLVGINVREKIKIIASGKIATGFHLLSNLALGADSCNVARAMMFALGCIQSLHCNTNACPTGVATQSKYRSWALDVNAKYKRVANYHRNTIKSFQELAGAMGCNSQEDLIPDLIYRRNEKRKSVSYRQMNVFLEQGELLSDKIHPEFAEDWKKAQAENF